MNSQKFVFGDYEQYRVMKDIEALAEKAKDLMRNGVDILPFPECWFEWDEFSQPEPWLPEAEVRKPIAKHVFVIRRPTLATPPTEPVAFEETIEFQRFGCFGHDRESLTSRPWWFSGYTTSLVVSDTFGESKLIVWREQIRYFLELDADVDADETDDADLDDADNTDDADLDAEDEWFLNLCLACLMILRMPDVKIELKRPSDPLIWDRVGQGQAFLLEHKVVTIPHPMSDSWKGFDNLREAPIALGQEE